MSRWTADVKDGILWGASRHGFDGNGLRGFKGYCEFLAAKHPKVYGNLIGRLLPLQVSAPRSSGTINIELVSVPPGHFLTEAQIAELSPQSNPRVIEHESTPDVFDSELEPLKS